MLSIITKTQDPFEGEHEADLKEITRFIEAASKSDGTLNLPHPVGDTLNIYYEQYHFKYQELIEKQARKYKPQTVKHLVVTNNQESQTKLREYLNKKSELATKKIAADTTLEHTPEPPKYKKRKWARIAIACLAVADMGLNVELLESWGFNKLVSWLLAPFLAVLFALCAHFIPKVLHRIKTPTRQKQVAFALFTLFAFIFWGLGNERAHHLTQVTGIYHSPWTFTVLSTVILAVAVGLSFFYLPFSTEEKEAIRRYENCLKNKETIDAEIKATEQAIASLGGERANTEGAGASTLETGYINENRILSSAKHGLALYKNTNIRNRSDGLRPDCFDTTEYPFPFTTYFNLKQQNNEND